MTRPQLPVGGEDIPGPAVSHFIGCPELAEGGSTGFSGRSWCPIAVLRFRRVRR